MTLLLFAITYLCEKAFFALVFTGKNKETALNVQLELWLKLFSIEPNIPKLIVEMRYRPSR